MKKPSKIKALETLARDLVGDGKGPNLYFVTDRGTVTTVSTSLKVAHTAWRELSRRSPAMESALEDRKTGVLASVAPNTDAPNAPLAIWDDVPQSDIDKG